MASCKVYTGNSNGVNVRSAKAVSSSNLLGVIDNDVFVNVVRCDNTWATLVYNGTPAFLQHQYLLNPPSINGDGLLDNDSNNKAVCNASSVNIRDDAGGNTTGSTLAKGASVTVYEKRYSENYYWYRIGTDRWVRGDFLAPSTSSNTGGGNSSGDDTNTGTPTAGVIQGTDVRVREQPNTTSNVITMVNTGDKVTYYLGESYSGSDLTWYRCTSTKWSGSGYIATQYVKKDSGSSGSETGEYSITATIDTSKHGDGGTVNLRSKPYRSGSSKTSIGNGKTIYVKNMTGTWLPAKYGSYEGYVMAKFVKNSTAYNLTGNETYRTGEYGRFYTGNRSLSSSEQTTNAQYILDAFLDQGWTKNAICGMLGNMQVESYICPGIWQDKQENDDTDGFGLTQWTPATKFFQWACENGFLYDDIDAQIERILHEVRNPSLQWSSTKGGMSFTAYTHSTDSAANLATVFCNGYEKPDSPDYTSRRNNATYWYNNLT